MKLIRNLFLLILLSSGAIYTYNYATDGFNIRQMTSSLPPYPQFEVALEREEKEALQAIVSQPFRYIGKGCQFYAFESADGQYVIKFLKHKHLRPFTWLQTIPMPKKWRQISEAKIERRRRRVENLFSSCKLAFEEMKEETGLYYIHLNRTPVLGKEVILIDKAGLKHRVQLDRHEYLIQAKAIPVKEVFARATSEEELCLRIEQLISLVIERCQKGIADRDRSFVQNVAFSAGEPRALFIDTGQFYKDPNVNVEADLKKRLGNLRYWTERYFPQYISVVDAYLDLRPFLGEAFFLGTSSNSSSSSSSSSSSPKEGNESSPSKPS